MKPLARILAITLLLTLLMLPALSAAPAHAAGPPDLTQVDGQVAVKSDGSLGITYKLTFHETESRNQITTLGPLDPGHAIRTSDIEGSDGKRGKVTLSSKGGGFYTVPFGFSTQVGQTYTLTIRYDVPGPLDTTTIKGAPFRVVTWAPVQWSLPIGEEIVRFILPVELPANITQPEQVTDAIVNQVGLVTEQANIGAFDRWVYYPTPDQGKQYLSIFISKKNLPANYHFVPRLYAPSKYFAQVPTPKETPGLAAAQPTPPPDESQSRTMTLLTTFSCFGCGGLLVALILFAAFVQRAKPKKAPVYQSPEIEVETFEKQGQVPDLNAIEAALLIGNTSQALTLVLAGLANKGAIEVVNRKPLQLTVVNAKAATEDYEQALVAGIAQDGTLSKEVMDKVLRLVSARMQPKLWNADVKQTRKTYAERADREWDTWERTPYPQRSTLGDAWMWILLSERYHPAVATAGGPAAPAASAPSLAGSPIVTAADQAATMMEGVSSTVATQMENLSASATTFVDKLFGVEPKQPAQSQGYDACHSACHSACVSSF